MKNQTSAIMSPVKSKQYLLNLAEELRLIDWLTVPVKEKVLKDLDVLEFFKKEGYWFSSALSNQNYPVPVENSISEFELNEFLIKLDDIEERIKSKNKSRKLPQSEYMRFMGYSDCRCCGQKNGTGEYIFNGWAWPEGYRHYLVEHKVAPSEEFYTFIAKIYFRVNS